jgi:uncharacterized protein (TIGR03437 family)
VGFELARYDPGKPLVIDPVISYATYVGGGEDEASMAIAVDAAGGAYITGATASADFPKQGGLPGVLKGVPPTSDIFVTKLSPDGRGLVYSTYIGGTGGDIGLGIAVDSSGAAYVAGATTSADFPVVRAIQPFRGGPDELPTDAFVLKLNGAGSSLTYSTYLGGTGGDLARAIAVDSQGSAYVTGITSSSGFPILSPFQAALRGGDPLDLDAFVTKLNATGAGLIYSTFLGGTRGDIGSGIAVDASGAAYVTGVTYSPDFPVMNAMQSGLRGSADAFVTKLAPSGLELAFSTLLGGDAYDAGLAVALGPSGDPYVAGVTGSPNFPIVNGAQQSMGSADELGADAFVSRLSPDGAALAYSTYLGGGGTDVAMSIAVGPDGSAFVAGESDSPDFPGVARLQTTVAGRSDAFLTRLNAAGSALSYSTLLGGGGDDTAAAVAVDGAGNLFVTGSSMSGDLPVSAGAFQPAARGRADALVMKVIEGSSPPRLVTVSSANYQGPLAPESIATGFGANLSPVTLVAPPTDLPTVLSGVSLRVRDSSGAERDAKLVYVSPTQVSFVVPEGLETGRAEISVRNQSSVVSSGVASIEAVAPSLFTANSSGEGVAAALFLIVAPDGSQSAPLVFECAGAGQCTPAPVDVSSGNDIYLLLFGTGFRNGASLDQVSVTVGGQPVPVLYAGPQSEYEGLDQINAGPLPATLAGRGLVEVLLRVGALEANPATIAVE